MYRFTLQWWRDRKDAKRYIAEMKRPIVNTREEVMRALRAGKIKIRGRD